VDPCIFILGNSSSELIERCLPTVFLIFAALAFNNLQELLFKNSFPFTISVYVLRYCTFVSSYFVIFSAPKITICFRVQSNDIFMV
jgi:hypothetical protein